MRDLSMLSPRARGWILAACLLPAALAAAPAVAQPSGPYRFDGVERVVAIGDVHGAYPEFVSVLQGTGLVDAQLRWTGGRTHLVSTGDLFSRGDRALEVVTLLRRLQDEAATAGGAVHVLLGNHEVMSLTGDLRYVSAGEFASFAALQEAGQGVPPAATGLPPGFMQRLQALAPDGEPGRWLLERPVMIVIDGTVFVHGGLSDMLAGRSLEEINRDALRDVRAFVDGWRALMAAGRLAPGDDFDRIVLVARQVAAEPPPEPGGPAPLAAPAAALVAALDGLPFQREGPVWYRGSSQCHPYTETEVARQVLRGLDARRVVVGHTPTLDHRISSRLDGQVLRIDTGMNPEAYHGRPSALLIRGDAIEAYFAGAGREPVRAEANREWARPGGMDDAALEAFLATAPVVVDEELELGVTHPRRLTLEHDGRRLHVVFKTLDTDPRAERQRWQLQHEAADRYAYELAAYRLDRLLGLQMVPVAVPRRVGGQDGIVQYWVEDAHNETDRVKQQLVYDSDCSFSRQHDLVNAFDVLVHNTDRNTGNILYDRDWQVWLIDHGRAFGTSSRRPEALRGHAIPVSPQLDAALAALTAERLQVLAPYLNPKQIQALVRRAQELRRAP